MLSKYSGEEVGLRKKASRKERLNEVPVALG